MRTKSHVLNVDYEKLSNTASVLQFNKIKDSGYVNNLEKACYPFGNPVQELPEI